MKFISKSGLLLKKSFSISDKPFCIFISSVIFPASIIRAFIFLKSASVKSFTVTFFSISFPSINNVAFEQQKFEYSNKIDIVEGSACEIAGLKPEDILSAADESVWTDETSFMLDQPGSVTFENGTTVDARIALQPMSSFKEPVYAFYFYECNSSFVPNPAISYTENIKNVSINFQTKDANDKTIKYDHYVTINFVEGQMEDCGLRIYVREFRYSFGEAIGQTFKDFGRGATVIADSLIQMITGQVGVDQLSGIVGIGFEAKTILDDLGVSYFIYLWGLISVNLAIVNLLPFPGLDGWQLLVIIIEGITRKKMPEKVKNIVSFIGLALLLVLMAVILFKDIWVYIIQGFVSGIIL